MRHIVQQRVRALVAITTALAIALTTSCLNAIVGPDNAPSNATVFDELWSGADLHYSFFVIKPVNWDSIRTLYRPRAVAARNAGELETAIGAMLAELRDPHVVLFANGASASPTRYRARADTVNTRLNLQNTFRKYVPAEPYVASARVKSGFISSDIGYVRIENFFGSDWEAEVDSALVHIASARSVIVDVRENDGGTYRLAINIAGRFVRERRTFGYLRFRRGPRHDDLTDFVDEVVEPAGPAQRTQNVFLLANARTASAAEVFTLALRSNPAVVFVGDTTAGMSGGPTARELSNGWVYRLSEWIEYTADHALYETIGLAPNVVVRATATDFNRGVDAALVRAVQLATTALASASLTPVRSASSPPNGGPPPSNGTR